MKRSLIHWLGLTGIAALLSYAAAVIFAPFAYPGYNWMAQAVSDLSAETAPSRQLLRCPLCIAKSGFIPAVSGWNIPLYGNELGFSCGVWDVSPCRRRKGNCFLSGNHAHGRHGGGGAFVHCLAGLPDRRRMQGREEQGNRRMGCRGVRNDAGRLHWNGCRTAGVFRHCRALQRFCCSGVQCRAGMVSV